MRHIVATGLCFLVFANLVQAGSLTSTKLTLVRAGKPAATIVLSKDATISAEFAVQELQYHFKKITGTELPIVTDDVKVQGTRILVGESSATRELGLRSSDFKNQEYLIRFMPDTLVLMGKDKSDLPPPVVKKSGVPKWVAGKHNQALSFDGVFDALSVADCRFNDEEGTMEAWVWLPAKTQEAPGTILRLDGSPGTYHIIQRHEKTSKIGYLTYNGTGVTGVNSGELSEGWHHVMVTYSAKADKLELFIDGVSQGIAKYARTTCKGATLSVGGGAPPKEGDKAGNALVGLIDEVRISAIVRKVGAEGIHIELAYGESKKEWDSGAVVVSDITASDRWTVQISLPLARLLPDVTKPGDKIYLNIIRSTAGNTALALCWVPTFGGYHAPSRLGELILMER